MGWMNEGWVDNSWMTGGGGSSSSSGKPIQPQPKKRPRR
jgi:hypothetical protein